MSGVEFDANLQHGDRCMVAGCEARALFHPLVLLRHKIRPHDPLPVVAKVAASPLEVVVYAEYCDAHKARFGEDQKRRALERVMRGLMERKVALPDSETAKWEWRPVLL